MKITVKEIFKERGIRIHLAANKFSGESYIYVFPHKDHFHVISPDCPSNSEKAFSTVYDKSDMQNLFDIIKSCKIQFTIETI